MLGECAAIGISHLTAGNPTATLKSSMATSYEADHTFLSDPAITYLSTYAKETKTYS